MQAATRQKEVSLDGLDIKVLGTGSANNVPEYHSICRIERVQGIKATPPATGVYDYTEILKVAIDYSDGRRLEFDIQDVTNQAGWTADLAGLEQAVTDINTWKETACGLTGTLEVNLDPNDDGVLVYGSPDGGATQEPIATDAAGNISLEDLYRFLAQEATATAGVFDVGMIAMATAEDPATYNPALNAGEAIMLVANKDTGALITQIKEGNVGGFSGYVELTCSLDTNIYATGDVLFDTQELTDILRSAGATGIIHSITLVDEDDQGQAIDLVFLRTNVSIGTENAAVSITDADAREILGIVSIATTDYVDMINSMVATKTNLGIGVKGDALDDLFIAGIVRSGTPTYTASGITIKVVVIQD